MKQVCLTYLTCLFFLGLSGQTTTKRLNEIKTLEQAVQLIESYPKLEARLFTISSDKDTSDITLPLFDKKIGYTFKLDKYTFKIIDSNIHPEFRVSYIYLDGSRLSINAIDSIRSVILTKFKNGTSFYELVKEYTMDGNPTGDTGWFTEKMMVKDFEEAVKKHKENDLFTIDIPENKWYYVTFKTFDDRIIKRLTILKIKSST